VNLPRALNEPHRVKLRVKDYLRLSEAGAFGDYAKTELIDGEIIGLNAQFSSHGHVKVTLLRRLADAVEMLLPDHRVWSEVSVAIPPHDTPAPDLLITNFRPHPRAVTPVETVLLAVEVADTTLREDLGPKLRLYARAGIPEYWVADLDGRVIHLMWSPRSDGYAHRDEKRFGERIRSATITRLEIGTDGLV
jgi:Uma2 family endonuclease